MSVRFFSSSRRCPWELLRRKEGSRWLKKCPRPPSRPQPRPPTLPPESMPVRRNSFFFLIFITVPAFAGHGDFFVTASIAEPTNLIPFFATDSASSQVSRLVFNGLVQYYN